MTRRWPDTLPEPSWPGYGVQPTSQVRRTQMEVGPAKTRRLTRARRDIASPPWRLTDEQMWAFTTWYYDEPVGAFGSDSLAGWNFDGASRALAPVLGPMGEPVDALVEDGSTGFHRAQFTAESVPAGTTAIAWASLRAAARSRAWVDLFGRDGVIRSVIVDLAAGVIESTSGVTTAVLTPRGNGWWRLTMTAPIGSGGDAPLMRIFAMDAGGRNYAGTSAAALSVAELQLRRSVEGRNLFVPAAGDGTALGAAAGAAWFRTQLSFGGGLTEVEARFTAEYAANPMQGLNWEAKGVLEVRNV